MSARPSFDSLDPTVAGSARSGFRPTDIRGASGLTFVELLIAVTMVAILFVGLSTHLRGGITVWQRVTRYTQARQSQRAALDRVSRDLANAVLLEEKPEKYGTVSPKWAPLVFSGESLSFYTLPALKNGQLQPPQFVSYQVSPCDQAEGSCLMRRVWSLNQARNPPVSGIQYPDYETLLSGCKGLNLEYAYLPSADPASTPQALEWKSYWEQADDKLALPRLIRLNFSLQMPSQETRKLTTVAVIPAGALRAAPSEEKPAGP